MKKIITILLCVLLIGALGISVFAAQSATVSVYASQTTVSRGDTLTVTVSTTAVENCTSGGFMFTYDTNVFEYAGGAALLGGFSAGISTAAGNVAGYFMNGNATVQGGLFQITLKVKDTAAFGTYTISGVPSLTAADGAVSCSAGGASVSVVCNHNYGNWSDAGNGQHSRTCSICSGKDSASHDWDSGKVTKQPTCKEEGIKTYTCTGCSHTKTEKLPVTQSHTWDWAGYDGWQYDGETHHTRSCKVCGKEENGKHSHNNTWSSEQRGHWHACTVCGYQMDAEAHTPGPEATETKPQICTVCKYVIRPGFGHVHDYAKTWTTGEIGHWYACSGCQEKKDYKEHDFENDCDPDCSVCGYTRQTNHKFAETWTTDENDHWHVCDHCGLKQEIAAHEPGAEATATTAQTCTICGYEIAPALETEPTESTEETTEEPTEEPTEESTTAPEVPDDADDGSGFPWWVVLLVAVVAIGGATAVVVIKKKKH